MTDKKDAAVATLENLGYTHKGGNLWKPPLGKAPDFNLLDTLHARIAFLEAQLSARQAAPDGQASAAQKRLTEAFPQAADCFHPLYIQGFKDGGMKGRYRGRAAALREVGAIADAVLAASLAPEREPLTVARIDDIGDATGKPSKTWHYEFARAIERAHGIGATNDNP